MVCKKELSIALRKANAAYEALQEKYNEVLRAYTDNLQKLCEVQKELYKLQSVLALPSQIKADKIIEEHETV